MSHENSTLEDSLLNPQSYAPPSKYTLSHVLLWKLVHSSNAPYSAYYVHWKYHWVWIFQNSVL